jgi:gamma-glutamyltranspeptidase
LRIEKSVPAEVRAKLEKRGHKLKVVDSMGAAQAIAFDPESASFTGTPDPRGEGQAAGY